MAFVCTCPSLSTQQQRVNDLNNRYRFDSFTEREKAEEQKRIVEDNIQRLLMLGKQVQRGRAEQEEFFKNKKSSIRFNKKREGMHKARKRMRRRDYYDVEDLDEIVARHTREL